MAGRDEILAVLRDASGEEPVSLRTADLPRLQAEDLPEDVTIQAVDKLDSRGICHLGLNGVLARGTSTPLAAYMDEEVWRKGWSLPLGAEDYVALVREAVAQRQRSRGDVELIDSFVEDNVIGVRYVINLDKANLGEAISQAKAVQSELLEAAEAVTAGVEDLVAAAEKRLQGWGEQPLDELVNRMREGTAHDKGLALEELASRLFGTVAGFTATGRVSTATEEIDIRIQNASEDEVWRREAALLIAECKNWSAKCGKDEFVLFRSKLENRTGRVSCGFLISWNGFAQTITAEMLRGTKDNLLIVPISGEDLRSAVREGNFPERLKKLHADAVFL